MRNRQAAVIFILVTVTLDVLAMGLIIPVLPKLILDFLGGKMTDAANWNGWFALVFALMQFVCSPFLGVLSDRFGRRPVILLSNLGLGLDYVVMALAPTIGWARLSCSARTLSCGDSRLFSFSLIPRTTFLAFGCSTPSIATPGANSPPVSRSWWLASARARYPRS